MKSTLFLFSVFGLMTIIWCAPTDSKEGAIDENSDEDLDKELLRMMVDDDDDDDDDDVLQVMNDDDDNSDDLLRMMADGDDNSDDLLRMMADDDDDDLQEFARFMALLEGRDKHRSKHDGEDVEVEETAEGNKESEGKEENEDSANAEDKDMAVSQWGWKYWKRRFHDMKSKVRRLKGILG